MATRVAAGPSDNLRYIGWGGGRASSGMLTRVVSRTKNQGRLQSPARRDVELCELLLVSAQASVGVVLDAGRDPVRAQDPVASRRRVACNNRAISTGE